MRLIRFAHPLLLGVYTLRHHLVNITNYRIFSNLIRTRIQSALVFADFLKEKKSQFAVLIRTFPSTASCLQGRLIE